MALGGAGCGCVCSKGMAGGRARDWSSASVPATAFCTVLALTSELLLLSHLPSPSTGPGHWMGSQCTLFICSLFSRQRNFYKIRDTNSNKLTFTSLRVLTTGQHNLVRKMFLFLVLSNFVVSLS